MQDQSEVAINKPVGNLFIFSINVLFEFALFSQISNVTKSDIKAIYHCLNYLNIDSIKKLISISIGIKILKSISKFFCETCILTK